MATRGAATEWQDRLDAAAPGLVRSCVLIGERPRSVILRGHSPEFGDVCVKYDPKPGGGARMHAEYEALRTCHPASTTAFGFPRPCALVEDPAGGAALVTSWIGCPRADERLARSLPFGSARADVLRRAAGWLAHFHRLGQVAERPLGSVLDLPGLQARIRAVLGAAKRRDAALEALAETIERHAGTGVRIVTMHGDFLPQNLFVCPKETIGADFTLEVSGPGLRDVGSFLANMVWRGYSTLDPRRAVRFERDADTFLATYHGGSALPEREAARLFILAELARKAEALSARIAARRFGTSHRAHRLMIVGVMRQFIRPDRALRSAGIPSS